MIECKELAGKVIRLFTIFEDGHYGPDIQIEFTDGTRFSACLKTAISIEPIRKTRADSRKYFGITAVVPFLSKFSGDFSLSSGQGGHLLPCQPRPFRFIGVVVPMIRTASRSF
jgi:hypothetical protein